MSLFVRLMDERFRDYRRRSTSIAGMAGAICAWALFEYRWFFHHVWDWDLVAVLVTIVVVKLALMLWYSFTR